MPRRNAQIVRSAIEAWNRGDFDVVRFDGYPSAEDALEAAGVDG